MTFYRGLYAYENTDINEMEENIVINNYKKWTSVVSILLVIAFVMSLTGCQSGGSETTAAPASKGVAGQAPGIKVVTDLVGNKVKIKNNVEKIAIVPKPWASIAFAVDGSGKRIAGMNPSAMKAYQNSILKTIAPEMSNANTRFVDNNFNINYEEVAKLNPDVVAIWAHQPKAGKKLAELGIPSVAVKYGKLEDVQNGIRLLGEILNQQERASALINYQKDTIGYLKSKGSALADKHKTKVLYLRDEQLQVATGESVNRIMIETAGGVNVANEVTGDNWKKVTMEQIMEWNPEVIILSNFSEVLPEDLYKNKFQGQDWSNVNAVKNKKVYKAPMGIYRWDAPCVETPLMIKWIAKVIHPETFTEYDIRDDLRSFYKQFFNYQLSDAELDQILNSALNPDLKI